MAAWRSDERAPGDWAAVVNDLGELGPVDVRRALFGGQGEVKVWDLLGRGSAPPFSAVLLCELSPGGSVGAHRQEHDPEIVIGLEGEATLGVGGDTRRVTLGQLVYLPLGQVLTITNDSMGSVFRYLIVKARG